MHAKSYVTVRYAETDRMGIAHHSNYPIWYEIGRTDYIRLFGTSYTEMEESGMMTPLINLTSRFIRPALYEDRLIVRTWVIDMSAARILFHYTVSRIEPDGSETELAYGSTEHGVVDAKTFKPCSIKKRLPELYEKMNRNIKEF